MNNQPEEVLEINLDELETLVVDVDESMIMFGFEHGELSDAEVELLIKHWNSLDKKHTLASVEIEAVIGRPLRFE
jgi:hypothetical protein